MRIEYWRWFHKVVLFVVIIGLVIWLAVLQSQTNHLRDLNHRARKELDSLQATLTNTTSQASSANFVSNNSMTVISIPGFVNNRCIQVTPGDNVTINCTTAISAAFYAQNMTVGSPVPTLDKRRRSTQAANVTVLSLNGDIHMKQGTGFWCYNSTTGQLFELTQRVSQFSNTIQRISSLQNLILQLGNNVSTLLTEIVALQPRISAVASDLNSTVVQLVLAANESSAVNETNQILLVQYSALEQQSDNLMNQTSSLQSTVTELQSELQQLQNATGGYNVTMNSSYIDQGLSLTAKVYSPPGSYTNNISDNAPHLILFEGQHETAAIKTLDAIRFSEARPSFVLPTRGWYDFTVHLVYCAAPDTAAFYDWYLWLEFGNFYYKNGSEFFGNSGEQLITLHGVTHGEIQSGADREQHCYTLHYHRTLAVIAPFVRVWTQFFLQSPNSSFTLAPNDGISESYLSIVRLSMGSKHKPFFPDPTYTTGGTQPPVYALNYEDLGIFNYYDVDGARNPYYGI